MAYLKQFGKEVLNYFDPNIVYPSNTYNGNLKDIDIIYSRKDEGITPTVNNISNKRGISEYPTTNTNNKTNTVTSYNNKKSNTTNIINLSDNGTNKQPPHGILGGRRKKRTVRKLKRVKRKSRNKRKSRR